MFLVPTDTPGVKIVRNVGARAARPIDEGSPRPHPLRRRAGAGRRPARRRGPGLRHRPDPPRRRPHPPRHAHHRPGAEGARHDVRAGAQPRDARAACSPTSSSCRATSPTPTPSSSSSGCSCCYTAWEIDKHNDYRQVRKDIAAVEGRHADGAARHRVAGDAGARRARRHQRDAVLRHDARRRRDGPRRRPDRGAQGHRRPPGAARLPGHRRHVADRVRSRASRGRAARSSPTSSSCEVGNL